MEEQTTSASVTGAPMAHVASVRNDSLPGLEFSVPPDASRLLRARERVRDFLYQLDVDSDATDDIIVAVEEACTNAVRHSATAEPIGIGLHVEGGDLWVVVKDAGRGFDVGCFDPEVMPEPTALGGRGLFLMSRLMDELTLRVDGGLEVSMVKRAALCEEASMAVGESHLEAAPGPDVGGYRAARRRALLDELGEAFVAVDWAYRYTYANARFLASMRLAEDEVLGRTVWEVFPYLTGTPAGTALRDAMELGTSSIVEFESPRFASWLEQRVYPTSTGVSVYLREISARKRRERERDEYLRALRESEERYRRLFQSMDEGFALHELVYGDDGRACDYRYLEVNQAFGRLTGLDAAVVVGRTMREVAPDTEPTWLELFARVAETGQGEHFEAEAGALGGWFAGYAYPAGGDCVGVAFSDVTARKRAEQERERRIDELQRGVQATLAEGESSAAAAARTANRLVWLAIPIIAVAIAVLAVVDVEAGYSPAPLFSFFNIVFLGAIPLLVAVLAARSYLADRAASMLFLGAGALALTIGGLGAALRSGGATANAGPAVYNSAAWLAGLCMLIAAVTTVMPGRGRRRARPLALAATYAGVSIALAVQAVLVSRGVWPVHFVQGSGQTTFGHAVLLSAAALFAAAALLLLAARDDSSAFRDWFALGLALVAVGLVAVSLQLRLGDPLNWLGRSTQYLGAAFMLVAVIASYREHGRWVLRYERALRESEVRYRRLVEMSPEAIVVHGGGQVLYVNPAAVTLFGAASAAELTGSDLAALIQPEDRRYLSGRVEGVYGGQDASLSDVRILRRDGKAVDVEGLQSRIEFGGRPAIQAVIHDVRERKAAEAALLASRRRADLLARTAGDLLTSVDPQPVLEGLCLSVMKELDCQVFFNYLVADDGGRLRLNASAGIPRSEARRIEWLEPGQAVCGCAALDACRIIAEEIPTTPDPRTDLVRSYGVLAYACHPLMSRGRVLGTLSFGTRTHEHFSDDDIQLMAAVADHVAIAIDRKQVLEDEVAARREAQLIATTLQEQLIHPLPSVPGLELGRVAETAYAPELVGGDFSDVFVVDQARVVALIGDVAGKGIKAAGLTETVHTAAASYALIDPSPAFILSRTNELLERQLHEHFVTAFVLVLDLRSGEARYASAGHPPPALLHDGAAELLSVESGTPLGVDGGAYSVGAVRLAAGDAIVLYTDGVTEARAGRELFGEERLLETLRDMAGAPPQLLAERLRDSATLFAGRLMDDLQILALALCDPPRGD